MSQSQETIAIAAKHRVTVIFGEVATGLFHEGETSRLLLDQNGRVAIYEFETERDLHHFLTGVEEASGWLDYAVVDNDVIA